MKDFLEISKTRYTAKHYDPSKKLSDEDFDKLCEILRLSPSSVNLQPWHFFAGNSDAVKAKLLPAIPEFNQQRFKDASHFIVLCAKISVSDEYLDALTLKEAKDGRFGMDQVKKGIGDHRKSFVKMHVEKGDFLAWSTHQAYIAMSALIYAAAQMGIDSTPMEGVFFDKLDEILDLKALGLHSVLVVPLGYRDRNDSNALRPKSRWNKSDVFTFI